jgi:hypothetical protein
MILRLHRFVVVYCLSGQTQVLSEPPSFLYPFDQISGDDANEDAEGFRSQ